MVVRYIGSALSKHIMTITKKETAIKLLSDATLPIAYQYKSAEGKTLYAFYTHTEYCDIWHSPFVHDPVCLKTDNTLTKQGRDLV